MASTSLIFDTPAGSQVRWYLETLASAGRNTSAADLERFSASASIRTPFPGQGEDLMDRLLMTDDAVVGVWPAGEKIRFVTDSKIGRVESRRGLVVDYGFITGVERDLESLLRAWCAQLKEQGLDTLTIFTSDASPGSGLLSSLADASEFFVVWTPGIAEPPSAAIYGVYVDSIYF